MDGLDALLVGPYDLSASLGVTGQFEHPEFIRAMEAIRAQTSARHVPCGVHVVEPSRRELERRLAEGYRFLAYSIDSVMLNHAAAFVRPE